MREELKVNIVAYTVLTIASICAVAPFILLIVASFTDDMTALQNGYSFFPEQWSLEAYKYIVHQWQVIGRAYFMTILTTVVGTLLSLSISCLLAYTLAQKNLPGRKFLNFLVIFTMLFNGGLVPTYMVYSTIFNINNTFWALVIPNILMSAFNIMLIRNYFEFTIPDALAEAARIDGAGEFRIFISVILPISKPILATIGLLVAIMYWNEWQNGLYYLSTGSQLSTIQNILNNINNNIQYIATMGSGGVDTSNLPSTTIRMAIAVVGILPLIVAYPFFQKYLVKGIAIGAVKG